MLKKVRNRSRRQQSGTDLDMAYLGSSHSACMAARQTLSAGTNRSREVNPKVLQREFRDMR